MNRKLRTLSLTIAALGAALCLSACTAEAPNVYGVWGDESSADSPNLTLNSDGTVSGTDGCNRIIGSFTTEGETVTFGNLATTMRFCEGIDTWLSTATSATITDNEMVVQNGNGESIGTLERNQ